MSDLWPGLSRRVPPAAAAAAAAAAAEEEEIQEPDAYDTASSHICSTCEVADRIETIGSDIVCMRCGTLVDTLLEWTAEYRFFSNDSGSGSGDPSRCSFPINHLMPESSLGTMIQARGSGAGSAVARRIKRYHMWNLMPYRERTLWSVFESLQVRASNAGIGTAVLEEAKELYAQLTASTVCRGQSQRDAMLAACLWEALKRHETPRMPRDIAEIFSIPMQNVTRGIKQFQHTIAFRTSAQSTDTYTTGPHPHSGGGGIKAPAGAEPEPESVAVLTARAHQRRALWQATASRTTSYEDFIVPFLTNLSIPRGAAPTLEATVRHVCARIEELGVVPENTPPSLTASVIAFASAELGIRIDHADLARVCGISAVTISKCLKRMLPWKEKLLAE